MFPLTSSLCIQILCLVSFAACKHEGHSSFHKHECKEDAEEPWSYRGKNGPMYWGNSYQTCNGMKQSPIALSSDAKRNPELAKLMMENYNIAVTQATIENNGHTVQITPTDGVDRTIFVRNSTYRLLQMHFHWGDIYYRGAEHILDGKQYSMELHLVHQNDKGEIGVVGVFFKELRKPNSEIQKIIKNFPKVLYKDNKAELEYSFNLNNLVPANPSSYYRYDGSLTTPDCAEGVTWSVLTRHLPVGKKQMTEFRKLYSATKADSTRSCKLSNNYRPVQPLNGRQVFRSE